MNKDVEILAPAGSIKAAELAIEAGADTLYVGLGGISMRPRRAEFTDKELEGLIKYAHEKSRKVYVVANIFPKPYDVENFKKGLEKVYRMSPDAVVIADLWALRYIKKNFKDLEAHISIQASVSSDRTAAFYEKNGADCIVIARSMPDIDDIKRIRNAVDCRLEVFAHGGICYMFDGNCYMSSFYEQKIAYDNELQIERVYGQNNTKGECHLVCKRNFDLNNGCNLESGRLMRRDDQVGLASIPKYIENGVNIFKIEGRAMTDSYVQKSVSLYRKAIDSYQKDPAGFKVQKEWFDETDELKAYRLEYEAKWNIK